MKIFVPLFLVFLTISQSYAGTIERSEEDVKEYDIEVLIFEDAHARYINSEMWTQKAVNQSEVPESLAPVELPEVLEKSFTTIKPGILQQEYKRINNSSEYNVLFYSAWRQTGLENSKAFEIDINELENVHNSKSENSITGHLKVVLARYLHFYTKLEYHRPGNQYNAGTNSDDGTADVGAEEVRMDVNNTDVLPNNNIYPVINHRRMRSKELHYIDHPLVGILVQINTVE